MIFFIFQNQLISYEILNQSDLAIVNGGLILSDAVARSIPALGLPQVRASI